MAINCGIVGLPNVGKSTIFSALTSAPAEAANYPFCTINPNVGIVSLPDARLKKLAEHFNPKGNSCNRRICGYCRSCKRSFKGRGFRESVFVPYQRSRRYCPRCALF